MPIDRANIGKYEKMAYEEFVLFFNSRKNKKPNMERFAWNILKYGCSYGDEIDSYVQNILSLQ